MSVKQVTLDPLTARLSFKGEPCFSAYEFLSQLLTSVQLAPGRQTFQYTRVLTCWWISLRLPLQIG